MNARRQHIRLQQQLFGCRSLIRTECMDDDVTRDNASSSSTSYSVGINKTTVDPATAAVSIIRRAISEELESMEEEGEDEEVEE